jgi:GNAT superfamily N-acetyltransferase
MNTFELYQTAYGNDPYWREGWVNKVTNEYITLDEYKERILEEDMSQFQLVYPIEEIQQNREDRSTLPWFQQILIWSAKDAQAVLRWRSCNYLDFTKKLSVSDKLFTDLYNSCNLSNSAYLAELFVRPDQQGKWLWTQLLRDYIDKCSTEWAQWILTRTTALKKNPKDMFLKEWFEEVYSYGDDDPRKRRLFYCLLK